MMNKSRVQTPDPLSINTAHYKYSFNVFTCLFTFIFYFLPCILDSCLFRLILENNIQSPRINGAHHPSGLFINTSFFSRHLFSNKPSENFLKADWNCISQLKLWLLNMAAIDQGRFLINSCWILFLEPHHSKDGGLCRLVVFTDCVDREPQNCSETVWYVDDFLLEATAEFGLTTASLKYEVTLQYMDPVFPCTLWSSPHSTLYLPFWDWDFVVLLLSLFFNCFVRIVLLPPFFIFMC